MNAVPYTVVETTKAKDAPAGAIPVVLHGLDIESLTARIAKLEKDYKALAAK